MISNNRSYGGNTQRTFILDSTNITVGNKLSGNTGNNTIDVNSDGVYKVRVVVHSSSNMPERAFEVYVYKNGSQIDELYDIQLRTLGKTGLMGLEYDLNAGDSILIKIRTATGNTYNFNGTFAMEYIGEAT